MNEKKHKSPSTPLSVKNRHKVVLKEMLANGGRAKPALKKAGYSKAIQKNPKKVLETKSFLELLDEEMPHDYVTKKHKQLMEAKVLLQLHFPEDADRTEIKETIELSGGKLVRVVVSEVTYPGKAGKDDITVTKQIAYYTVPNTIAQDKALDKVYKIRGSYAAEKKDVNVKGLFSLSELASGDFYEEED